MTFGELLIEALERSIAQGHRWLTQQDLLDMIAKTTQHPSMDAWEKVVIDAAVRGILERKS